MSRSKEVPKRLGAHWDWIMAAGNRVGMEVVTAIGELLNRPKNRLSVTLRKSISLEKLMAHIAPRM